MKTIIHPHHDCRMDNSDRKGAASVEFALVSPLLILLILGTIDVGQFVNASETVGIASRIGARSAAKNTTQHLSDVKSDIQDYLSNAYPNISSEKWNSAINVNASGYDGSSVPDGNLSQVESGSSITIDVSLEFGVIRWMTGAGYLNGNEITSSTTMRRE
jgi:Flp pilus assembly protein TadG